MATFGENLRALREERGETQQEVADLVGMGRGAISKYEKNEREPDMRVISVLAEHYGVTIDFLTGKSDIRGKPDFIAQNIRLLIGENTQEAFLQKLKELIGVTIQREELESYLSGKTVPSLGVLQAMADLGNVGLDFFYRKNDTVSYTEEQKKWKEGSVPYVADYQVERFLRNRDFLRLAEKIVENDLDIQGIEQMIELAIHIKKHKGSK